MIGSRCTMVLLAALFFSSPALGVDVMYASSNGSLRVKKEPGRYSALNVLDGNKATVWCSRGTGQNATLEVMFSEVVSINKLDVTMGNQSSPKAYYAYSRINELTFSEGDMVHPMSLADKIGVQTLEFDPVLETDRVVIKLKSGYRGNAKRNTCISDLIFYSGRRPLNGSKLKKAIRKAKKQGTFMDSWVSGPELNKTHLLVLGLNNKYRMQYVPQDPTENGVYKNGDWRIKGGNPELKIDRKTWLPILVRRDDAGRVLRIKVENMESLDGVYIRRSDSRSP